MPRTAATQKAICERGEERRGEERRDD